MLQLSGGAESLEVSPSLSQAGRPFPACPYSYPLRLAIATFLGVAAHKRLETVEASKLGPLPLFPGAYCIMVENCSSKASQEVMIVEFGGQEAPQEDAQEKAQEAPQAHPLAEKEQVTIIP